jgi:membrane protein
MSALHDSHRRPGSVFVGLMRAAWNEYQHDHAHYFAGAMVYYALVSLVPLLLLALSALGLLLRFSDLAATTEQQVLGTVETNFGAPLRMTIEGLLQHLAQGSGVASLVSLVGMLFAASVLFRHLRMTFRAIWKRAPILTGSVRGAVHATFLERAIAFVIVIGGGILLIAAFLLIGILNWLIARLDALPLVSNAMSWLLPFLTPLLITPITFAALFAVLPPVRLHARDLWLATLLSSLAWLLGTEILVFYVANFGAKFSAYGAIGGLLIFMLWIHTMTKVLFFGGELCKVVHREHSA